jgi:hypothetical protein
MLVWSPVRFTQGHSDPQDRATPTPEPGRRKARQDKSVRRGTGPMPRTLPGLVPPIFASTFSITIHITINITFHAIDRHAQRYPP